MTLMFPVLQGKVLKAIPWSIVENHEQQALNNHSQTLRGLASRGGLTEMELYYLLRNERWPSNPARWITKEAALEALLDTLAKAEGRKP